MSAEIERLKDLLHQHRVLLIKLEWTNGTCPCCGEMYRKSKHVQDCELKALLAAIERATP